MEARGLEKARGEGVQCRAVKGWQKHYWTLGKTAQQGVGGPGVQVAVPQAGPVGLGEAPCVSREVAPAWSPGSQ